MDLTQISGSRALAFASEFDYIREAGTQGERDAAEEFCRQLRALGLQPGVEEFPVRRSWVRRAVFRVTAPFVREYPAAGLRGSGGAPDGIRAEFLYAEDGDEITLSRARGKILLLCRKPNAAEYAAIEEAGAVGLVCVCGSPGDREEDCLPQSGKLYARGEPRIPVLMLHYRDARQIVEAGAREAELILDLQEETACSRNVIATIPGSSCPEELIALSAHLDSVPEGPGAYDDLAGAAIVFEVCRWYAAHPPRRTLQFCFFGAEELGCLGSLHHLRSEPENRTRCRLDLNVDLAGQTIGGTVLGVTAGAELEAVLVAQLKSSGIGARLRRAVWSGDANIYARWGIPAVTLDRDGYGMHTRGDRLELLSAWALGRDARLLAYLTDSFDSCEALPFARRIPENMARELAERYPEQL